MSQLGGSFSSQMSAGGQKQAGVGLLLAEVEGSPYVIVKQVVPRGAADRTGRIRVGDQILKVAGQDAQGMGVTELRNIIVGDQGSKITMRFKHPDTQEMIEMDLVRGTPEFLDGGMPPGMHQGMPQPHPQQMMMHGGPGPSLYASGGRVPVQQMSKYMLGTTWSQEMFNQLPPPQPHLRVVQQDPVKVLQEENEWLRSALRMAESSIMKHRQDLGQVRELFVQQKVDSEGKIRSMEDNNRVVDDERREAEQALLSAEEYRRALEVKLREAQRRSEWMRETEAQIMDNERARIEYLQEVKRRADEEKRGMEQELMRLQDDLRAEKISRSEAEQREASLRSDFQRLTEHRAADASHIRSSFPDTRSSYDNQSNLGESFAAGYIGSSQDARRVGRDASELMLA